MPRITHKLAQMRRQLRAIFEKALPSIPSYLNATTSRIGGFNVSIFIKDLFGKGYENISIIGRVTKKKFNSDGILRYKINSKYLLEAKNRPNTPSYAFLLTEAPERNFLLLRLDIIAKKLDETRPGWDIDLTTAYTRMVMRKGKKVKTSYDKWKYIPLEFNVQDAFIENGFEIVTESHCSQVLGQADHELYTEFLDTKRHDNDSQRITQHVNDIIQCSIHNMESMNHAQAIHDLNVIQHLHGIDRLAINMRMIYWSIGIHQVFLGDYDAALDNLKLFENAYMKHSVDHVPQYLYYISRAFRSIAEQRVDQKVCGISSKNIADAISILKNYCNNLVSQDDRELRVNIENIIVRIGLLEYQNQQISIAA